jgi:hypothetical protein
MSIGSANERHYEVALRGDHVYLRFKGHIEVSDLEQSTDDIVALAKREHAFLLLDDIRELDRESVTIRLQTEAIGLLWHLRHFKKIALLYSDNEIGNLVATTLQTIHLAGRCRAFDNEADALTWLEEKL